MKLTYRGPSFYIFLPLFLIFFAVPYLFDVAFCEDLYSTPLSQAALIDGEKVDPYEGESSGNSLNYIATDDVSASSTSKCFAPHSSSESYSVRALIPVLLTSRPPPAS